MPNNTHPSSPHPSPLLKGEGANFLLTEEKNIKNPIWSPSPSRRRVRDEVGWFTFVELLIVITIIAITGAMGIGGLSHLMDRGDTENIGSRINSIINSLDDRITDHKNTDYEIMFTTGSIGYTANENQYGKTEKTTLSFSLSGGTGTLGTIGTASGTWITEVWRQGRFSSNSLANATGATIPLSLSGGVGIDTFDIYGNIEWTPTNSFQIGYYSEDGLLTPTEKQVVLTAISGASVGYSSLTLRNTLGRRELLGNGTIPLDTVSLVFSRNGKEVVMDIKR